MNHQFEKLFKRICTQHRSTHAVDLKLKQAFTSIHKIFFAFVYVCVKPLDSNKKI